MKKQLEKKLSELDPPGTMLWFYNKHISKLGFGFGYFTMMLSGSRTMRDDVRYIINGFLNQEEKT